ncbi:MAG TPA: glycosyltransferase family 1 protein [Anaerolineae bacterium]|nr:glycosyltransferase family 1 protein [Anaerolineae bacterium]
MRIALVTKPDPRMTGLLRYALSLHEELRAQGVDVALVQPTPPPAWMARAGRALGLDAAAFFGSYPLSVRLDGAEICHLASQTLATLLLTGRRPPAVVTVHDLIPHLVDDDPALSLYRRPVERLLDRVALRGLRRAAAIVAISEFTKRTVVQLTGYPADHIHVVYRAVDGAVFKPLPVPDGFRRKYELEAENPTVLYVGSEDPRKNVDGLLRAFARVRARVPTAQLLKVGAPHFAAERQRLLGLVDELGLDSSVRFLDHVPDEDLPLFYNAASVFVLPSFYEGFGLPALEAMSCGTPVVASDRASLPEVVGQGGALLDPDDVAGLADRIAGLLADPQWRAAASEVALLQAARFSLARQAEETLALYRALA